jgi:hypothetical protein
MMRTQQPHWLTKTVSRALPILCALVGIYLLVHSIRETFRIMTAGGSVLCTLTGLPLVCPTSDAISNFQTGASLQISQKKLGDLARQIELDERFVTIRTLPHQLHMQANWVNDNVKSLLSDSAIAADKPKMKALVIECASWSRSLHTTARQVRGLQLTIQSFARRVVEVLPIILNIWKSGEGTLANLRHGFAALRDESDRLNNVLRDTDNALAMEREHASQFLARMTDHIILTQDEILAHAETWSWATTAIVYGAAASAGIVSGGTMSAPAALLMTSIAHLAKKTADARKSNALDQQRIRQESAALALKNARSLLEATSDELQTIQHEMEQSEDGLNEIAIVVASENDGDGTVRLPTAYTAKALPNGGVHSDTAQQLTRAIEDVIKAYHRVLEATEQSLRTDSTSNHHHHRQITWEERPASLPSLSPPPPTSNTVNNNNRHNSWPQNTQKRQELDNETDMKQRQMESLFDSIQQN